jgi:DHA1 family bicyclomycin/chloramphenicol resistance-like MFS transporter
MIHWQFPLAAAQPPALQARRSILPLAAIHAFAPLTVDMYLPSLPTLERFFHASTSEVQFTLTTFFLGFAVGQTLWGPIADRYGRRGPLYCAMLLFFVASVGCAAAPSISALAVLRLAQAAGACGGSVIARAMVRDSFPPLETRRAFSTLIMWNAFAPAIAPLLGGAMLGWFGWQSVFWVLAAAALIGSLIVHWVLGETLPAEARQPLDLRHIFRSYGSLLRERTFLGSSLVTGFSSAGLFSYIAGAPFVFIQIHKLSPQQFSWIFGTNAVGIILASQINVRFLQGLAADRVLKGANLLQLAASAVLLTAAWTGAGGLVAMWLPLFVYVATIGVTFPNGSAIALAKHGHIAGIASALLGTNQFGLAVFSTIILGALPGTSAVPMATIILCCAVLATAMNFTLLRGRAVLA